MRKEEETTLGFKQWIMKTIIVTITLLGVVYVIQLYFDVQILVDTLIAITIVLVIGFTHEALHYRVAVRLGYAPKWWRTKLRMGFEIAHHSNRKQWLVDKKKIAIAPYIVLIPISVGVLCIGIYFENIGVTIAGIGSLLLHGISWPTEGKEI